MSIPMTITDEERDRLDKAKDLRKYGHLSSWKELLFFQMTVANPIQYQEIAYYAKRNNSGEKILLPLIFQKQKETPQEPLL